MKSNVIKDAFGSAMKKAGFQKKSDGWYRDTNEAVLVANLQKSNFGEQYYVNLGIWLKVLGEVPFPKEYQCHIRVRAATLEPERQKYWESEVFNLEHREILDAGRFDLVQSFLETTALPFLLACGSLSELRRLHREGRFKGAAIMVRAREILQSQSV
jgi:hypothetical protein